MLLALLIYIYSELKWNPAIKANTEEFFNRKKYFQLSFAYSSSVEIFVILIGIKKNLLTLGLWIDSM